MKHLFTYLSLLITILPNAYPDTPGARFTNAFMYDGSGANAITSTTSGLKKGIDIFMSNPSSNPGLMSIVVGGTTVDPRSIRLLTGSDIVTAQQGGSWSMSITGTVPLPTGAATEITLSAINSKVITTINGIKVDGSSTVQPISAGSLPLPTGAATSVLQTTGNSSLSSIDGKTPALVGGRVPVDGSGTTQPISASSLPLPTGASTAALQTATNGSLNSIDLKTPVQGQKTMANSSPVVIASDQSALPISIANIDTTLSSRASESTLSSLNAKVKAFDLDTGAGIDNNIGANLRFAASGGSVEAGTVLNPLRVDVTGVTTQPINGTVTANIGTPGSLALESSQLAMSAKLPATLGQKTMANSMAVTWASDQSGLPVTQSGTWNINNISGTVSLPTGASTAALQNTINTTIQASQSRKLQDGNGNIVTSQVSGAQRALDVGINVAGIPIDPRSTRLLTASDVVTSQQGGTWNIGNIAGTITLPSGASTSVLQTTGNSSLSSIDGKIKSFDLDSGGGTELVQGANLRFENAGGSVQAGTSANPLRTDPTGTTTQPISGSVNAVQSGTWNIGTVSGVISLPTGASTSALQTSTIAAVQTAQSRKMQDGVGNSLSSTVNSGKQSLDVNVTGITSSPINANQGAPNTIANKWPVSITNGTFSAEVNSNNALKVDATATTQPTKITDADDPSIQVSVKDAMTAATTADKSLVVAISPNSPVTAISSPPANVVVNGTLTTACLTGLSCAAGSTVNIIADGKSTLGYETHGTWDGVMTTDISYDPACAATPAAVIWYNTASWNTISDKAIYVTDWDEMGNNAPWVMNIASVQCARLRAKVLTSGTVIATLNAGVGTSTIWSVTTGNILSGLTDSGAPVKVGGRYNSTLPSFTSGQRADLQLDSNGRVIIRPLTQSGDAITAHQGGVWDINNISGAISLPTGASTSTLQTAGNSSLSSIDTKLADGNQRTRITDGTNNASITNTTPSGSEQAIIVRNIPSGTQTVSGTVTALQGSPPWSVASVSQGNITSNSPDSGNPIKIGGVYNSSIPTLDSGDRGDFQLDASGRLITRPLTTSLDSINAVQSGTWNINNISGTISLPTGAATSALQTTANSSLSSIDGKLNSLGQKTLAGSVPVAIASDQGPFPAAQFGNWSTRLQDGLGNDINSSTDPIDSERHLQVSTIQDVNILSNNSSTTNLGASGVFTGAAQISSGFSAANISLYTTQNCTVQFQQSPDGVNWDITDTFNSLASVGISRPFRIVESYIRVVVTNLTATPTTQFRLNTSLTPIQAILPRTLTTSGNLRIEESNSFTRINTASTTTVKSSPGFLSSLCYNNSVNGTTITLYDNTIAAGTIIAVINPPNGHQPNCLNYNIRFSIGLTIVTTTVEDLTISYQ